MKKHSRIILVALAIVAIVGYTLTREYEIDPVEAAFQKEMAKRRSQGC
jgi:hypothetical protein